MEKKTLNLDNILFPTFFAEKMSFFLTIDFLCNLNNRLSDELTP